MAKNINLRMTYYGASNIEELIKDTVEDMYAGAMNFKGTIIGEDWQTQMPKTYSKGDTYAIQLDPDNEQQSFLIIAVDSRNVESSYLEEEWQEIRSDKGISPDSIIMASQVKLDNDITLSGGFDKVGNLNNDSDNHTTLDQGQSLQSVLEEMLAKDMVPTRVNPVCSLSFVDVDTYDVEIGTNVTPKYKFTFISGKFEYEDGTSVLGGQVPTYYIGGVVKNESGTLPEITISETPYGLSGEISYTESAEGLTKPKGESTGIKIPAGTANVTTNNFFVGYRNIFYYWGEVIPEELTNDIIRGWNSQLSSNRKIMFTTEPENENETESGLLESTGVIYIAVPNELSISYASQIQGGITLEISDQFVQLDDSVAVKGANDFAAIDYKLYKYNPAILPYYCEFTIDL